MDKSNYYTIGEIAKICDVNVRTLHYYDSINLVRPKFISEDSNYRYYTKSQIPIINSVKRLRGIGLSIKEIKLFLAKNKVDDKFSLLKEKYFDIEKQRKELLLKQQRIKSYLEKFEDSKIKYDKLKNNSSITIKEYPSIYVAYSRKIGGISKEDFHFRFSNLSKLCNKNKYIMIGNMMVIFYNSYRENESEKVDVEICIAVEKSINITKNIRFLESFSGVTCFHHGSFSSIKNTYNDMLIWIKNKNLKQIGSVIENHIVDRLFTENEDEFITEIIIPIK